MRARRRLAGTSVAAGFTLIEMMIVVAVVAVIAAVAIPQYREYVTRAKRAEAKRALAEAAQFLERNFTAAGCYNRASMSDCLGQSGTAVTLPSVLRRAPAEGKQSYEVTVSYTASGQAFTLLATPCANTTCTSASVDNFSDGVCGIFQLDNTGARSLSGTYTGAVETCWQR